MSVTERYIHFPRLEEIEPELENRLRETKSRLSPSLSSLPLAMTTRIDATDILEWLRHQPGSPRVYWANRRGDMEIGGTGAAQAIIAGGREETSGKLRRIEEILEISDDPRLRFIGGRSFDTTSTPDTLWSEFHRLSFHIPRLSITREQNDCYMTIVAEVKSGTSREQLLEDLSATLDTCRQPSVWERDESLLEILSRVDHPDLEGWNDNIDCSLAKIAGREMDKVVLARRTDLTFSECADPFSFLSRLRRSEKNCFAFFLEPCRGKAFVVVTPERLFRVRGNDFVSEAISGTRGRGDDSQGNEDGVDNMLFSGKNLLEHQYVLDDITERSEGLCDSVHVSEKRSTFELSDLSHIYSRIAGTLKPGVSLGDIISTLHPTPAVGGTPREKALELLEELEPFDRGWYASPVGIIGQREADIAVAIRSAVIEKNRAYLFAGAGIVSGSRPDSEWLELEQKISHAIEGFSRGLF